MASLARSLLKRLDRFLSIEVNPEPVSISNISTLNDVQKWRVFSDAAFGGASRGVLTFHEESAAAGTVGAQIGLLLPPFYLLCYAK